MAEDLWSTRMIAYVGSFTTTDRGGEGEGITVFSVEGESQRWSTLCTVRDLSNPAFLAVHPQLDVLYSVHGGEHHESISAFTIDRANGAVRLINTQPSGGLNPVHLDIDPTGSLLTVANYIGGSVALLPLAEDGALLPFSSLEAHHGPLGPNRHEQESAHPHQALYSPDARFVHVPDKGLDRVFTYEVDVAAGRLLPRGSVGTPAGAGPRHIAFHPTSPWAYVVNELASSVTRYTYDSRTGQLRAAETIDSTHPGFEGHNTASGILIHESGRFLYASNRGADEVAVLAIDPVDGRLSPIGWEPSGGSWPRFISFDPGQQHLIVANQTGNNITVFAIDGANGSLTHAGKTVSVLSPTCVVFA